MDFVRLHIIRKIKEELNHKLKVLDYDGFFYFDTPITDGKKMINRIYSPSSYSLQEINIYHKEEILPVSISKTSGLTLLDIYSEIKENRVYIYKMIKGKSHKMRIKNNDRIAKTKF